MSKTISGYEITIRAFMPCGSSSADHAKAMAAIESLPRHLESIGCNDIGVGDKWAPRKKIEETPL